MSLSEFLQSHDLLHLSDKLLRAGYTDLSSLRLLAQNEEYLDALNLVSREAKKLAAAISQIPTDRNLPTILALPLAEFEREQNPVLALWAMCDFAELTLKLLVMAAAAEHEVLPEAMSAVFHKRIERPTLGGWHDMARVAVENLAGGSVLPMLAPAFKALSKLVGLESQGPDKSLLFVRNRLAHGRPTRAEATEWLKAWRRPISVFVDKSIGWLAETRFVAVDEGGRRCLLQGEIGSEFQENTPIPQDAPAGSAWLLIGKNALDLGLLAAFDFENRAPLVYVRSQDVSLQYLRIAATGGAWESNIREWTAFQSRFLKPPKLAATRTIRLFDEEINREAQRRVGRERELLQLWKAVAQMDRGCIWIGGAAGIGKSNLMASLMQRLRESPPENVLVLPYRFRSQDDRNSRGAFLSYLSQQLDLSGFLKASETDSPSAAGQGLNEVMERLDRLNTNHRVLLVVDGLDEIMQHDERFVEDALLCFVHQGVVVVGAGRPESGIRESFRRKKAVEPFPDGLNAMTQEDVRSMLFDRLFGEARRGVLLSDREEGGKVENTFIEQVATRSEGLPIYVNYVIGDISARRVRPDNPNDLPRGIHAYHAELLRRCSTGDLQAVVTPMLVAVALAHEPLSEEEITALLKRFGRLETMNLSLVGRGLALLGSMLRRSTKSNGKGGITVYHDSLRSHILQDLALAETVASTKRGFANESIEPEGDAAKDYLYRNGVKHLLSAGRFKDAVRLQTDFDFLMARFRALEESGQAAADWYTDWERLRKSGDLEGDAQVWWDFARTHRHYFRKEGWESWRVLFQAAINYIDDSPVTVAAEQFVMDGKGDWIWLRCINRSNHWFPHPVMAVLVGHQGLVNGTLEMKGGRLLSWSEDRTLRIWDPESGVCNTVLSGHGDSIVSALEIKDGRILSWSLDESMRVWDPVCGESKTILLGVKGALELSDGRILSWSREGSIRVWDPKSGECTENRDSAAISLVGWDSAIELRNGWVLFRGYSAMMAWNSRTGTCTTIKAKHEAPIWGAISLKDNSALSWSRDGTLRLSELTSGYSRVIYAHLRGAIELSDGRILFWSTSDTILRACHHENWNNQTTFLGHKAVVIGAVELKDRRLLSWACDGTLRIWDPESGECNSVLSGHGCAIVGALELKDGRILSWSTDQTIRLWDLQSGLSGILCLEYFQKLDSIVWEVKVLQNNRVLSWSPAGHDLVYSNLNDIDVIHSSQGIPSIDADRIVGALKLREKRLLTWSSNSRVEISGPEGEDKNVITLGHFAGNQHHVWGASELRDGRILTWSSDQIIRISNPETGTCLATLQGHDGDILGAIELKDGRILSWSSDGTLRIWNSKTGICASQFKGDFGDEKKAIELRDGNLLVWSKYFCRTPKIWDPIKGLCRAISPLPASGGICREFIELQDGRLLSWSSDCDFITICTVECSESKHIKLPQYEFVKGMIELKNGNILSWCSDGTKRAWDIRSGQCQAHLTQNAGRQCGVLEISNTSLVSWFDDRSISEWNPATGETRFWRFPKDWESEKSIFLRTVLNYLLPHVIQQFDLRSIYTRDYAGRVVEPVALQNHTALLQGCLHRLEGIDTQSTIR